MDGCGWPLHGMTVGNRDLLAPSIFQLRTCFGIQTVYALAVDEFTALAQIQIDHIGVTATMTLCRGDDLCWRCNSEIQIPAAES